MCRCTKSLIHNVDRVLINVLIDWILLIVQWKYFMNIQSVLMNPAKCSRPTRQVGFLTCLYIYHRQNLMKAEIHAIVFWRLTACKDRLLNLQQSPLMALHYSDRWQFTFLPIYKFWSIPTMYEICQIYSQVV